MVTNVTSFGRSGVSDWLVQRISGVVIGAYAIFMLGYLLCNADLDYEQWLSLHQLTCIKIFSTLTLLSVVAHAWIGMWVVLTDYVTVRLLGNKATVLRLILEVATVGLLAVYTLWGIDVIWGV